MNGRRQTTGAGPPRAIPRRFCFRGETRAPRNREDAKDNEGRPSMLMEPGLRRRVRRAYGYGAVTTALADPMLSCWSIARTVRT
jgi:hypothetical protein